MAVKGEKKVGEGETYSRGVAGGGHSIRSDSSEVQKALETRLGRLCSRRKLKLSQHSSVVRPAPFIILKKKNKKVRLL